MGLLEFYEAIQQPRLATNTMNRLRRNQVVPVLHHSVHGLILARRGLAPAR